MDNESFFHSAQLLLNFIAKKTQQAIDRGEYYNIFDVLNLSADEVKLHSAFIADLLNPKGRHGLGTKPLKSFTKILNPDFDFDDVTLENCKVKREYVIGPISHDQITGGNIDILLTIGDHLIIIENKIHAGDQPRQMLRYHNFAKSQPHHILLVYLTPKGDKPSENSSDGLVCGENYICKSYKKDITGWIEQCLGMSISKPLIRETLQQYLYTIKTLTDTIMEEDDKSELFALMDQYPDVTRAIMKETWEYRRHLVFAYIIEPLQKWCEQKQYKCYIDPEFKNQGRGVWFGISLSGWKRYVAVKFKKQDYGDAYYGIWEPDANDPYSVIMPGMTAFEKFQSWSVDIAKDITSRRVFNDVCDKLEQLMTEIEQHPEKYPMN